MTKTIKITSLIDKANAYFENSPVDARMERLAVQSFMGSLLHDTGNYAGFGYLMPYADPASDSSRIVLNKSHRLVR